MNKGRLNSASDNKCPQVKMSLPKDHRSQTGSKAEDHLQKKVSLHSNKTRDANKHHGLRSKRPSSTLSLVCVPLIKWNCPPLFTPKSEWEVAAGEESEEKMTETIRQKFAQEAFYPRRSAIPLSPRVTPEVKSCDYDDSQTPTIPLTPIEEVEQDTFPTESTLCAESIDQKSQEVVAAAAPNADIPAAALAALTALLKSHEKGNLIDTDLLVKILNDPKMVERLLKLSDPSTETNPTPSEPNHKPIPDPLLSQTIKSPISSLVNNESTKPVMFPNPHSYLVSGRPDPQMVGVRRSYTPGVIKDTQYWKNLIRLHGGKGNDTQGQLTSQLQVGASEISELTAVSRHGLVKDSKILCKFFNRLGGCRRGPSCKYEHVLIPNLHGVNAVDINEAKRSKILKTGSEATGQSKSRRY